MSNSKTKTSYKSEREKNREMFPTIAAVKDDIEKFFGKGSVKVEYAEENGNVIGDKPEDF